MENKHEIVSLVYEAKNNMQKADELIKNYIPFILSEASKQMNRQCSEHDDEFSVAMIAFHEAIRSYCEQRGTFFKYAGLVIGSRIKDYYRKEKRHKMITSLDEETTEEGVSLYHTVADNRDYYSERVDFCATKSEIEELGQTLKKYGLSFTDVAENSPKQKRTLKACSKVVQYAIDNPEILNSYVKSGRLPLTQLSNATGVEIKTIERHRKYLAAMLLIQTNGYEIIRGHLSRIINAEGRNAQ